MWGCGGMKQLTSGGKGSAVVRRGARMFPRPAACAVALAVDGVARPGRYDNGSILFSVSGCGSGRAEID